MAKASEEQIDALNQLPVAKLKAFNQKTGKYVEVLVDGDYDFEYFNEYKWVIPKHTAMSHVVRYNHYEIVTSSKTGEYMGRTTENYTYLHHMVLPQKKGYWTVHLNGDPLDCRSANLEYRTPSDSARMRKQTISEVPRPVKKHGGFNSTPYRGVQAQTYNNARGERSLTGKYQLNFCGDYKGTFNTAEMAARAYDLLAKKRWGDRAVLNFPKGGHNE